MCLFRNKTTPLGVKRKTVAAFLSLSGFTTLLVAPTQAQSYLEIANQRVDVSGQSAPMMQTQQGQQPPQGYPQQVGRQPPQQYNNTQFPQQTAIPVQSSAEFAQGLPNPNIVGTVRPNIPQEVKDRLYPINPDEIREILGDIVERRGAATTPEHVRIRSTASQYEVDMSLGATPPIVRVAKGMGAMVNFVDGQGNPWPIVSATNFHAESAQVDQVAEHVLSVASKSPYLTGSVGVMLEGLSTPVNFTIIPATDERDFRVDLRIPQLGPNAQPLGLSVSKPSLGDGNIKDFLYGATPEGATRLKVTGEGVKVANTRAWQNADGRLILRTAARVISPGWIEAEPALDGTTVYMLSSTPVVRVSVDGRESMFYVDGLKPTLAKKEKK